VDFDHQPVMITFDIEHNPIIFNGVSSSIAVFDVIGGSPLSVLNFFCPRNERIFCVSVVLPKLRQFLSGNKVHFLFYPILGKAQEFVILLRNIPASQPEYDLPGDLPTPQG
jgi:hypothetical protein